MAQHTEKMIENVDAWERGREAAIRRNATKGRNRKWLAEDESRAELQDFVSCCFDPNTFVGSMNAALAEWGRLTEAQEAALRKVMAKQKQRDAQWAEEHANAADCPSGRAQVTGTIVSVKLHDYGWGPHSIEQVWKMVVRDDSGFKVWGTITSKMFDLCRTDDSDPHSWPSGRTFKGKRVSFTAAIQPSENDAKFGFYKRPTKIEFEELEQAPLMVQDNHDNEGG